MSTPQQNYQSSSMPWLIIIAGCLITFLTFGPRSAMGFFQLPIIGDKGWDRSTYGLAMALQNLFWGAGQPIFGMIADKYGSWRVLLMSGLFYAAGLVLMANADAPIALHIGGGVLVGLGVAAGSYGIILSAFARHVSAQQRSLVFGLGTAAGSAGMFAFAPISLGLIERFGWSDALVWLGVAMLLVPLLAIPLRGNANNARMPDTSAKQTAAEALKEALSHKSYLFLTAGFFVCGFQVAFITTHFPAYISDIGVDKHYAVWGLALIGFFNIIGSLGAGILGQTHSKPKMLSLIYLLRSILVAGFILLPQSGTSVLIFSGLMGLLWLSTVPPTNGLVATMFGTRHLGLLGGMVFFSHQIGSFIGVWLGGTLYQLYNSYDAVWWLSIILGLFAALIHLPIRETAVQRPALAAA
ncbi:MFS transporter [Pseudochrobactrum sp. sp1633]|uniref:MFS transporter n=1 Tax=Pseudochrobactrum sp. sp1633 TaxID=3036706 RepID=UPI0025A660C1|nr:MFS transporter [Pseudochrobactrum sp. sp1633]MDM8346135.1 MFS transporter [Pseudochrobactrum sp. sp1633]HWD13800.1 MFS transporter [Pseudochrobactrum sp.]